MQVATRHSFCAVLSHPLGSIDLFYGGGGAEALSCIQTRELSFIHLIPHNFTLIPLSPVSSTSNHTQVGFYKKLKLFWEFASPKDWGLYPGECKAAHEEVMTNIYRSVVSNQAWTQGVARSTLSSPACSPSYRFIWATSADLCIDCSGSLTPSQRITLVVPISCTEYQSEVLWF